MPFPPLPSNQEDREVYLRDLNADSFIDAIKAAPRDSIDTIVMTIKAFDGEPELLYVALDYAYNHNVTVTMATPASEHDEAHS